MFLPYLYRLSLCLENISYRYRTPFPYGCDRAKVVTYVQGVIRSLSSSRSTQAERTLRLQPVILGIGVPLLHLSANAASDTLVTVDTLLVLLLLLLQGIMGRVHTARVGHLMESEREREERDRKGEREH